MHPTSSLTSNFLSSPSPSLPAGDGGVWTTPSERGEKLTDCAVVEQHSATIHWDHAEAHQDLDAHPSVTLLISF